MNAGIITIGDELIQGFTSDTNSKWLSKKLNRYNIKIHSIITIGDDRLSINTSLNVLLNCNLEYIFITGGLGPTHDDITKKILSEYFNKNLDIDKKYLSRLKKRFQKFDNIIKNINIEKQLESQAKYIKGSVPIFNREGTALGMLINHNKTKIFVLPGVPDEMKNMLDNEIIPKYLSSEKNNFINYITISTTGAYESKLYDILQDIIKLYKNKIKLAFLPRYTGVDIRISKKNSDIKDKILHEFKIEIQNRINKYIYSDRGESLEEVVSKILIKKKMTLSIAESCTGGFILKKITDIAGSSKFLKGGVVAYNNKIKEKLLNVSKKDLDSYGAVSKEVATQMAEGIKKTMNSDVSIATTGIAGPSGGGNRKPLGLIFIAICNKNKTIVKKFNLIPKRHIHREISMYVALNMLRCSISELK